MFSANIGGHFKNGNACDIKFLLNDGRDTIGEVLSTLSSTDEATDVALIVVIGPWNTNAHVPVVRRKQIAGII